MDNWFQCQLSLSLKTRTKHLQTQHISRTTHLQFQTVKVQLVAGYWLTASHAYSSQRAQTSRDSTDHRSDMLLSLQSMRNRYPSANNVAMDEENCKDSIFLGEWRNGVFLHDPV